MTNAYNVVYTGNILSGFDEKTVKSQVTQLLKLSPEKVGAFFSGQKVTIKKKIDLESALKIQDALRSKGLAIQITEDRSRPQPVLEDTAEKPMFELVKDESTPTPYGKSVTLATAVAPVSVMKKDPVSNYQARKAIDTKKVWEDEDDDEDDDQPAVAMVPPFLGSSFDGRYGRLNFVNATSLFFVSLIGLFIALAYLPFTLSIFFIAPIYYFFRHLALRCHDLNLPAYTSLLILVPYVNLLFILALLVLPGKKGSNDYGPPSEQGPIWGLIGLGLASIGLIYIYVTLMSTIAYIYQSVEEYEKNKIPAAEIELVAKPFMEYLLNGQYADALSLTSKKFQLTNLSSTLETNFDGYKYTHNISKLKLNEADTEYEYFYPFENTEKLRFGGALIALDGTSKDYQPTQAYISLLLIQEDGLTKIQEVNFDEEAPDDDDYSDNDYEDY